MPQGRALIAPKGDKRYVRRNARGQVIESDDVKRSLSSDRRRKAKRAASKGQGDRGDRRVSKPASSRKTARSRTRRR